jgi:Ca2+-binding EF-hand superfamily protein
VNKTLSLILVTGLALGGTAFAQEAARTVVRQDRGSAQMLAKLDQNADGKLSREELQAKAASRFDAMDANQDGKLSQDEVAQHVAAKREKHQAKRVQRMQAADKDGDGKWSQAELSKMPERVFAKLDSDHDGYLTKQELEARKAHGRGGGRGQVGERMLGRADANKDGVVDRSEALQLADTRFSKLDKNGDGAVDQSELQLAHHAFGRNHGGRCHAGSDRSSTPVKS